METTAQANATPAANTQATPEKTERKLGYLPGKYAQPATYLYGRMQYYFGLSKEMAHVCAEAFMSDAGRARCNVEGVKITNAKKADGTVGFSETGDTRLAETYALRIYRSCEQLDKVSKQTGLDPKGFKGNMLLEDSCNAWLAEKTKEAQARHIFVEKLTSGE